MVSDTAMACTTLKTEDSGMGQGIAASSSVGAIVEDQEMFARGIIFSALPETQAIYGFLIAILLMVFGGIL